MLYYIQDISKGGNGMDIKDNKNSLLIFLLIISITLNFYYIRKSSRQDNYISNREFNDMERILKRDLDEIYSEIIEIRKEISWLSDVDIKGYEKSDGTRGAKFSWNIKDYIDGTEVKFFNRETNDSEYKGFQELAVIKEENGFFSVEMGIAVEDEPRWEIQFYQLADNQGGGTSRGSGERYVYEYYISMKDGNHTVTSDIKEVDFYLDELAGYSPLFIDLTKRDSNFAIDVGFYDHKEYPIEIILEIYNGEDKKEEFIQMYEERGYGTWETTDMDFDRIVARAKYSDSSVYIKEIWKE